MAIVVPNLRRRRGQSLRAFRWRLAHKFVIYAPMAAGSGYGIILGIAAQANRGTGAREFFDNQITMWRAIVLSPYGPYWLLGLLLVWLLIVLWTGTKEAEVQHTSEPKKAVSVRLGRQNSGRDLKKYESLNESPKPPSDRNVGLSECLGYAIFGEWGKRVGFGMFIMGDGKSLDRAIEKFRSAAAAGDLRTWGLRHSDAIFVAIKTSYWETHTINRDALNSFMPTARTMTLDAETEGEFSGIMVNRTEVESVWPHEG